MLVAPKTLSQYPMHTVRVYEESYKNRGAYRESWDDLREFKYIGLSIDNSLGPNIKKKVYRLTFAICLDVDDQYFRDDYFFFSRGMPLPNWITTNPKTKHQHIVWLLDSPVNQQSLKAEMFLSSLTLMLAKACGNSTPRNKNATQNPLHPYWNARWYRHEAYSLQEIAEYNGVKAQDAAINRERIKRGCEGGYELLGRDCAIFKFGCQQIQIHKHDPNTIGDWVDANAARLCEQYGSASQKGLLSESQLKKLKRQIYLYGTGQRVSGGVSSAFGKRMAERRWGKHNAIQSRAKALGMARSTFYAKKLNQLVPAIAYANAHKPDLSCHRTVLQEKTPTKGVLCVGACGFRSSPNSLPVLTYPPPTS